MHLNFKSRIVSAAIVLLTISMITLAYMSHKQQSAMAMFGVDRYSMLKVSNNSAKIHEFVDKISRGISSTANLFSGSNNEQDIIVNLKSLGKTIMLSSHILPELGTICDLGLWDLGRWWYLAS